MTDSVRLAWPGHGRLVSERDFTKLASEALIVPFVATLDRKLVPMVAWPERPFVWLTSEALTEALPELSPTKTPMLMAMLPLPEPALTPVSVTVIVGRWSRR